MALFITQIDPTDTKCYNKVPQSRNMYNKFALIYLPFLSCCTRGFGKPEPKPSQFQRLI